MNKDIEKYELEKWRKENPEEYKEYEKRKKEKNRTIRLVVYFGVVPMTLINYYFKGPPILYLLFGLIPYILRKIDS